MDSFTTNFDGIGSTLNAMNNKFTVHDIQSSDRVVLVRSAYLGDFAVCIPFIKYLTEDLGLQRDNIFFVIINDGQVNPVELFFGKNYFPTGNIFLLDSAPARVASRAVSLRAALKGRCEHILYLPFQKESRPSLWKKSLLLKFIFGFPRPIRGLAGHEGPDISISQYQSLLDFYGAQPTSSSSYLEFLSISNAQYPKVDSLLLTSGSSRKVAIYPHSKLAMKIWPARYYLQTIRYLVENHHAHIFLIGGDEDRVYNDMIMSESLVTCITNLAGKLTIRETILFLSGMDLLIGNDGAPLHMAALANTPVIGLFTGKVPLGMWDPVLSSRMTTIQKLVACRECYRVKCAEPICLTGIEPIDVMREVDHMLTANAAPVSKAVVLD